MNVCSEQFLNWHSSSQVGHLLVGLRPSELRSRTQLEVKISVYLDRRSPFGPNRLTSIQIGRVSCQFVRKLTSGVVPVHLAQSRQERIEDASLDRSQVVLLARLVQRLKKVQVVVSAVSAGRSRRPAAKVHGVEAFGARDAVPLVLVPFVGLVVVAT